MLYIYRLLSNKLNYTLKTFIEFFYFANPIGLNKYFISKVLPPTKLRNKYFQHTLKKLTVWVIIKETTAK